MLCLYLLVKYVIFLTRQCTVYVILPLTQDGTTPLHIASQEGHSEVVSILIRNGSDTNLATNVWRYYNKFTVPYNQPQSSQVTSSICSLASFVWSLNGLALQGSWCRERGRRGEGSGSPHFLWKGQSLILL